MLYTNIRLKESYPYQEEFVDFLDIDRGLSERSIEAYCIDLRVFAGFLRGMWRGLDVCDVEYKHIRGFLTYLKKERNNNPKTRNRKLASLRCYFGYFGNYR